MMTNPKAYYKHSDLFDKLNVFFGESMNLTRIKFISLMILALCKVQTVSFHKLSTAFESGSEALSCMRRIQRFMSSYALDFDLIALNCCNNPANISAPFELLNIKMLSDHMRQTYQCSDN